jgi:hypothetical protein
MNATRTIPAVLALALLLAGCPGAEPEVDPAAQPDPVPGAAAVPEDTAPWRDTLPEADAPRGPAPPDRLAPTPPDPEPGVDP